MEMPRVGKMRRVITGLMSNKMLIQCWINGRQYAIYVNNIRSYMDGMSKFYGAKYAWCCPSITCLRRSLYSLDATDFFYRVIAMGELYAVYNQFNRCERR